MTAHNNPSTLRFITRFAGVAVGLALFGGVIGFAGAGIGSFILRDGIAGFGALVGALSGLVIGYPLGVIAGIVMLSLLLRFRGSLLFGIIGAVVGSALPAALAEQLNLNPNLFFSLYFAGTPLLGTVGYFLIRRR
jgi:hypothetical protein